MPTMYSVLYDKYIYMCINPFKEAKGLHMRSSLGNLKRGGIATFASLEKVLSRSEKKRQVTVSPTQTNPS